MKVSLDCCSLNVKTPVIVLTLYICEFAVVVILVHNRRELGLQQKGQTGRLLTSFILLWNSGILSGSNSCCALLLGLQVGNAIKSSLHGAALKSNNKEGARSIQVEITPTSSRISRNAVTSLSIRGHRWKRHGKAHTQELSETQRHSCGSPSASHISWDILKSKLCVLKKKLYQKKKSIPKERARCLDLFIVQSPCHFMPFSQCVTVVFILNHTSRWGPSLLHPHPF